MNYGMQFTEWLEKEKECETWFRWFEGRGVPAGILQDGEKFAVFRKGNVKRRDSTGFMYTVDCAAAVSKFNTDPIILKSCNGYTS